MDNNKNQNPVDVMQQQPIEPPVQPKTKPITKVLAIFGGVVAGIIVIALVIIFIVSANSNKLVCESKEGNITIMYNDEKLTGYTATGMSYELEEQQKYAKQVGVKAYLDEFSTWFKNNTTGTCTKKEK